MMRGGLFMNKDNQSALYQRLISWPPLGYLLVFFAIPTLIMVMATIANPGDYGGLAPILTIDQNGWHWDITLDNYHRFFEDSLYLALFIKSFGYAVVTTLCCLVLAYPLAMLIARSGKQWRDLLILLVILPFWSNFLIRVYAWMIILSPEGALSKALNSVLIPFGFQPVTLLYSPFAVIVGLVYVHLPFMILPLYANLEKHDPALLDAAQDLGAGVWSRFWKITFPLSLPGVFAGSALVFIPALGAFAVSDILGGTDGLMIGNLISQQFLGSRDWPFGSVLSIILTVLALGGAVFAAWIARKGTWGKGDA